MDAPLLNEFKRQASFFLKEKIKTARLALTDVTPAQILTEEATNGDLGAANVQAMRLIARAAFEVDDFWRIVDILHKRLMKFSKRNWRQPYKAMILLEYLLTHGPESVADEFQTDEEVIIEMGTFQYIDEKGFNWGLSVQNKSERVIRLLEDRSFLKEERTRERKVAIGINGFGSFSKNSISDEEESMKDATFERYLRSNSEFCKNSIPEEVNNMEKKIMILNKQKIGNSVQNHSPNHPFFEKESHSRISLLSSTS